jgi:AraC-like DNA-binding protein
MTSLQFHRHFSLTHFTVYRYHHTDTFSYQCHSRSYDGFCYVLSGNARFEFPDSSISATQDTLVYLPRTSSYTSHWSADAAYLTLDFAFASRLILHNPPKMHLFGESDCSLWEQSYSIRNERAQALIRRIYHAYFQPADSMSLDAEASFHTLCAHLLSLHEQPPAPALRIRPAMEAIEADPTRDHPPQALAKLCALGISRFFELFRQETGLSPIRYRNARRIEMSRQLLIGTDSIEEIADRLGFSSADYFTRVFKGIVGMTPGSYRKNHASDK